VNNEVKEKQEKIVSVSAVQLACNSGLVSTIKELKGE
jgi:hypothetical protein